MIARLSSPKNQRHQYTARAIALAAAMAFSLIGGSACSHGPAQGDCEKLLDHVIEIEITAAGGDKLAPEMKADLASQKAELEKFLGKQFMTKCLEKTPKGYVECGLKAKTPDDLAACDKQ